MIILIRIILFFLIYFIGIFLAISLPSSYSYIISIIITKLILHILGFFHIQYDKKKLQNFFNHKHKFILLFNHISFMDGWILWSIFGNKIGLLVHRKPLKYIPYCEYICENIMKCILIDDSSKKTSDKIIKAVENNDHIVAIAPDAMQPPIYPNNIGDFKTGAFVGKYPVKPVLIKFKNTQVIPDYKYEIKETIIHAFLKMFLNWNATIEIKILDMIYPKDEWTVEQYKNFVKDKMESEYL